MTIEEFELLPHGFIRKYGSMLNFMKRVEKEAYIKENKDYNGYYD